MHASTDFNVLLSYSLHDSGFARELTDELSEAGLKVLDPQRDATLGENVPLKIGKALEAADSMVVLLSGDAVRSPSVKYEVDYALGSRNFEHRLVSVLLEPTDDVPWILRKLPLITVGKDRAKVANRIINHLRGVKAG